MKTGITIMLATFDRAPMLRDTLEAMTRVDRNGLEVEWVVVNNNCSDDTDEVVKEFMGRLPLRLLHEQKPGKNRALNRGLAEAELKELVVFIDDDVRPVEGWLQAVVQVSGRWPGHMVFGGRIVADFPAGYSPDLLKEPWLKSMAFASHDHGDEEFEYGPRIYPFGPNFWVRRKVFQDGHRYLESIGPTGNSRIMGSETSFLKELSKAGMKMVYGPSATVNHQIKPSDCDPVVLRRRAVSCGRGCARIEGVDYHGLLSRRPVYWHAKQGMKWIIAKAGLFRSRMVGFDGAGLEPGMKRLFDLGCIEEGFRIAAEKRSERRVS